MYNHLPLAQPKPNASEFIDILAGKIKSPRIPPVEYIIDNFLMQPITSDLLGQKWVDFGSDRLSQSAWLDNFIEVWYRLGYDFVRFEAGLPFSEKRILAEDPTPDSQQNREWVDLSHGNITSWEDFETFNWPKTEEMDFFAFEYINSHLPEGMGFITCHAGGILEHLSGIMSYKGLCLNLFDNPKLVQAIVDRLGNLFLKFYEHLVQLDNVIAIFQGDDMGFRTGTLISPDDLRKYVLPWHKRLAQITHKYEHPYYLHSCGNVISIMEDLITEIKIDGKHSFEDAIIPVQEFQQKYGQRIAVLGGLDLNILSAAPPEIVRANTRRLMETCGSHGRYAIGSGNSIPSYVPLENYLTMVDEVHHLNGTC